MVITILLIHLFSSNLQLFSSKRGIRLPKKKFRGRRASPLENGCGKNITQLLKRIIAKLPLDYSGFQLPFIQKTQKNTAEWRCIF